jgi:Zn-dependent protease with chaperone function
LFPGSGNNTLLVNIRILVLIVFIALSAHPSESGSSISSSRQTTEEYFQEFVSPEIQYYPNIDQALKNVFSKLSPEVLQEIKHRDYPILFVPTISSGIARYAHAVEFTQEKGKNRAFRKGFYLIMLGDQLNQIADVEAIEGVILHEIAHRYLNHAQSQNPGCELEREANRLVKKWGFEAEYKKASAAFGHKESGDSPCHDHVEK